MVPLWHASTTSLRCPESQTVTASCVAGVTSVDGLPGARGRGGGALLSEKRACRIIPGNVKAYLPAATWREGRALLHMSRVARDEPPLAATPCIHSYLACFAGLPCAFKLGGETPLRPGNGPLVERASVARQGARHWSVVACWCRAGARRRREKNQSRNAAEGGSARRRATQRRAVIRCETAEHRSRRSHRGIALAPVLTELVNYEKIRSPLNCSASMTGLKKKSAR